MRNQSLLLPVAVVGLLIAILYPLAFAYLLFWNFWWYDLLLHFLGGAFVVFFARWSLFAAPQSVKILARLQPLFFFLAMTLIVGVLWEFFEYAADLTYAVRGYWFDTYTDLLMDTFGGLSAYLLLSARRSFVPAQPMLKGQGELQERGPLA